MAQIAESLTVSIGGGHRLSPDAARQWIVLNAAFRRVFGIDIPIKSAWRSNARQSELYALYLAGRGNLALPPGRSTHNKGLALDIAGNAALRGTAQHNWIVANGSAYGWKWTGRNFSQIEPWHFDYVGGETIRSTSDIPVDLTDAPQIPEEEDDMDKLLILISVPQKANAKAFDWYVQNLADRTVYNVPNMIQVDYLKALGVRTFENQHRDVIAGFRSI